MPETWDTILICIALIGIGYMARVFQELRDDIEEERSQK